MGRKGVEHRVSYEQAPPTKPHTMTSLTPFPCADERVYLSLAPLHPAA